jgi:hypothetical protein
MKILGIKLSDNLVPLGSKLSDKLLPQKMIIQISLNPLTLYKSLFCFKLKTFKLKLCLAF